MAKRHIARRQILDTFLFLSRKLPVGRLRHKLEIGLRGLPSGHPAGCRAERINALANQLPRCDDYLEVGVQYGFTLSSVNVENKTGVDPELMFNPRLAPGVTLYRTTSDEFFANLSVDAQYDLVFLDGLHTFAQTTRDFLNALMHLRPGGLIVVDDVVPSSEAKALPDRNESLRMQLEETGIADGEWFGDVWKLPVALDAILRNEIKLEVFGYGVCGQAVVKVMDPRQLHMRLTETEFYPYSNLRFADFFPGNRTVLLPGYQVSA